MKHIHLFFIALLMFATTGAATAQVSQVVYAADGMSGELVIKAADFTPDSLFVWTIDIPDDVPVLVTRTNNTYIGPVGVYVFENDTRQLVNQTNIGIYTDTIFSASVITVVLDHPTYPVTKDPAMTVRFSVINQSFDSGTITYGGDLEIPNGTLTVSGHHNSMGIDVSAVLGGKYSDYTCFGSPRGGRIRGSNEGYLVLEGNPLGYGTNTNVYINRYVGGNVLMTSSTGKVGIGTDAPKEKLHIAGAVRGNGPGGALTIRTEYGSLTLGPQDANYALFSTDKKSFRFNKQVNFAGGLFLPSIDSLNGWHYSYLNWASHSLVLGTPVGRNSHNAVELRPGGAEGAQLFSALRLYTATGENQQTLQIELRSDGNCIFNNPGKMGIGTSNPQYKLDVNGSLRANEILVNIGNGADFVFEDGYQLRPLQEVSTFIQENGHLPEIQSAADMQENGVSMNQLQIQLLQKIEELTLYLIQQEQTIQQLQEQINSLTH
ncbi:MAG: hypothetical protein ACI3Z5_02285 [Paludibacteraceae bacterium]